MKLDRAAIVLRPRTVPEIVDLAFRLSFSFALPLYSKLAAVVLLPILAGALALRYAAEWDWLSVWLVTLAAGNVAQGVFTVAAGRLLFSEDLRVSEVLGSFTRRLGSYFIALVLSRAVLCFLAMCVFFALAGNSTGAYASLLLVVGLPFAWTALLFLHEASLLEGAGPAQACQRASRFVKGRSWSAFGLLLLLLLGQGGAVVVSELIGQGLLDEVLQLGKPLGSLWADQISPFALAGLLLSLPFVATARFLHYIDTRTRADGWDVQVRFLSIAAKETSERRLAA